MARPLALAAAIAVSLLAVSGAGGAGAQTPKRGGTVVVGVDSAAEPPCLNPLVATCATYGDTLYWGQLLRVVMRPFEAAPSRWLPGLVSNATLRKDPFTVTYDIRSRVRWSDGVPVTASDYVFGVRMLRRHIGRSVLDPRGVIRAVHVVDANTVRVVFRSRYSDWRFLLNLPALPRHVLVGEDLPSVWKNGIDNPKTGSPIGDGPFLVQRWEQSRRLTLVRNPRYWGPHTAYLDRLVFRFVPPSEIADALRSGEVDLAGGLAHTSEGAAVIELVQQPALGVKVLSTAGAASEQFEIRVGPGGHPALRNKLVRRALAYGIDREALVEELYGKIAPKLRPLNNTIYLTNEQEYRPNWSIYQYRPAEARRLLGQAGCRLASDGIYLCAGERLSLRFVTTAGNPTRAETLRIVQAQLRRVGVEVVPVFAPGGTFFRTILPGGAFDVALFSWAKSSPGHTESPYRCGSNSSGYCSRLVTADLNQLDSIVDPKRLAAVANRADRRLAQDVPAIPLFQTPHLVAFRNTIHGVIPNPFSDPSTWNGENWWLER